MLVLRHDSPIPLYSQLYSQLRDAILTGKLAPDSRLPSVRELAVELAVSRNTVESAYLELYAEGYLYTRPRSGYFVSALSHDLPRPSPPREAEAAAPPAASGDCEFDFHPARLDPRAFPTRLWRKSFLCALQQSSRELHRYCDPQGEYPLRRSIQKYLESARGVACSAEQIVVSAGLQHGLGIVADLLRAQRPVVAVEDPGYHLARAVFRNHSFEVVPIPVRSDGLDVNALEGSGSTVAYVTPSHQFPLGCVMPIAHRLKLIAWARSRGALIIEDDYDSELRYHGRPIPSLQGLDPGGSVVYSGTFSKVLSPALRVSYLVLPHSLLPAYRRLFQDYVSSVSVLEQRTLAEFMEQGHWERHLRRMRTLYKKKHDALLTALARYFGETASVVGEGAGLHVVLQLHGRAADEEDELVRLARDSGINLLPYAITRVAPGSGCATFLIGFGGLSPERIEEGIALLYQSWHR